MLADTGESEVFYDSEITDLALGDRAIDYDDRAANARRSWRSSPRPMPAPTRPMTRPVR
jgi:hypothetical protein